MGFIDRIKARKKEKIEEMKQRAAANRIIRKKGRAAYLREKEKAHIKAQEQKAREDVKTKKSGGSYWSKVAKNIANQPPMFGGGGSQQPHKHQWGVGSGGNYNPSIGGKTSGYTTYNPTIGKGYGIGSSETVKKKKRNKRKKDKSITIIMK